MSPGAALPLRVGVVSLVDSPFCIGPTWLGVVHNAVDGRCSTHRDQQIDVVRRRFTGNAVARRVLRLRVSLFRPSVSGVSGVRLQVPSLPTTAVPIRCFAGRVGGVDKDGVPGFTDTTDERFAVIGDVTAGYIA